MTKKLFAILIKSYKKKKHPFPGAFLYRKRRKYAISYKPKIGLEPTTPSLRVKCSTD